MRVTLQIRLLGSAGLRVAGALVVLGLLSAPVKAAPPAARIPLDQKHVPQLIDFKVEANPAKARAGTVVRLTITGNPAPGHHTYPLTQRTPDQSEAMLTHLEYSTNPLLQPLWPMSETKPEVETIEGVGTFWEQRQPFTWSQDILIRPEAKPGPQSLPISITIMVCEDHGGCSPAGLKYPPLSATIDVSDEPPVPLTAELQQRLLVERPAVKVVPAGEPAANSSAGDGGTADSNRSLWSFLLVSVTAAVAMLFTPCVFPMIPITVSFFLKQSEKKNHNALVTAAVYSLTIIIVLTVAVLLLGKLTIDLGNSAWFNLALGALLVFFALSLFGMYEIELPSGLARFTAAHEGKGGYLGAFFMALTFTITSFTCTGPFLGPLLVSAKESQIGYDKLVLGALAYSGTFAAPFFVLALFPRLLRSLPKSGGWLNAVKVVMGFLELGAALKFLANTDLAWHPGSPLLFNYETVLCAWIALSIACGLYLLGLYRLPHDTPIENLGVVRMLLAAIFLGMAIYMVPALWRITPQGVIGQGLVAFLPLDTRANPSDLAWTHNYEEAWKRAADEGKLIFIDFTGQNCTNCRYNEKNVFVKPDVRKELEKYVRVQLYTDFVPDPALTTAESAQEGRRNQTWQKNTFEDVSNPFYAIIKPVKDASPFRQGPHGETVLNGASKALTRKGQIPTDLLKDFEDFLRAPQQGTGAAIAGLVP